MRLLVIKTSSLGDVLHTLPAVTDAAACIRNLEIDWLVEENYAVIPNWHPAVNRVIPVALRRWRRGWNRQLPGELKSLFGQLRLQRYDRIIDAQGLLKSALLGVTAKGPVYGLDRHSIREPVANLFYRKKFSVSWHSTAVQRLRLLFSQALDYPLPDGIADYGFEHTAFPALPAGLDNSPGIVLLHGTTWPTKRWPLPHWQTLAGLLTEAGYPVFCAWGNAAEHQVSLAIRANNPGITVLESLSLGQLARVLAQSTAVVAVDTGPGHLAAAVGTPCVSLYLATDPQRTGTVGHAQQHLVADYPCAPCLHRQCRQVVVSGPHPPCGENLSPTSVFERLQRLIRQQSQTAV